MIRRHTAALLITGAVVTGAAAIAATGSISAAARTATTTGQAAGLETIFGGIGRGHGGFGGLTVTAVGGNTISATDRDGQIITILVGASTTYAEAGATASLADVHVGSRIAVQRATTGTGTTTVTASGVTILLPTTEGTVSAVSGDTITVKDRDNTAATITVSGATRYQKAGKAASLADITPGTTIRAEGTTSGTTLSAQLVTIEVPHLDGQVTAVSGTTYTITDHDGTVYTVTADSGTTYVAADGTASSAAAVKVGVDINAEGTLSSDGKTLTAVRVSISPAGSGHGGGHGGDNDGDGPGGTPPTGGATSTTGTATA